MPCHGLREPRNALSGPDETDSALRDVKRRWAISRAWPRASSPTGSWECVWAAERKSLMSCELPED